MAKIRFMAALSEKVSSPVRALLFLSQRDSEAVLEWSGLLIQLKETDAANLNHAHSL